ncbi:MAG: AraC family transcriptional regulator [Bacteroidota bacterium]
MKRKLWDKQKEKAVLKYGNIRTSECKESGMVERITERSFSFASGRLHEVEFENFHIGHCKLRIDQKTEIPVITDTETLEMEFVIQGKCIRVSDTFAYTARFNTNRHNLSYLGPQKAISRWESPSGDVEILQINLSPDFFLRYLERDAGNTTRLGHLKKAILQKRNTPLSRESMVITSKIKEVVKQIITCDSSGMVKRLYLESRILYLLSLQIEQFLSASFSRNSYEISQEIVEKIYNARIFLEKNLFAKHITLPLLAREVGTNEYTLKKGFKEVYGTSVFGFWKTLKMTSAKEHLQNSNEPIADIAEKLGYKNQRHFSTAFKKIYGVTPSMIRNPKL